MPHTSYSVRVYELDKATVAMNYRQRGLKKESYILRIPETVNLSSRHQYKGLLLKPPDLGHGCLSLITSRVTIQISPFSKTNTLYPAYDPTCCPNLM